MITTKFCKCQDSFAVVTCANFHCDLTPINKITAKCWFYNIWILNAISLVKWTPEWRHSHHKVTARSVMTNDQYKLWYLFWLEHRSGHFHLKSWQKYDEYFQAVLNPTLGYRSKVGPENTPRRSQLTRRKIEETSCHWSVNRNQIYLHIVDILKAQKGCTEIVVYEKAAQKNVICNYVWVKSAGSICKFILLLKHHWVPYLHSFKVD